MISHDNKASASFSLLWADLLKFIAFLSHHRRAGTPMVFSSTAVLATY